MSLRTRLVAAFTILIVTSASATILIGATIFGERITAQAIATTKVGRGVVAFNLASRQHCLAEGAAAAAVMADEGGPVGGLCRVFDTLGARADFVLVHHPGSTALVRRAAACSGGPGGGLGTASGVAASDDAGAAAHARPVTGGVRGGAAACRCAVTDLPRGALVSALGDVLSTVSQRGVAASGFGVLDAQQMQLLGYPNDQGTGILFLAATPLPGDGDGQVLIGALLDSRADLLLDPLELLWSHEETPYEVWLFTPHSCVANAPGAGGRTSHAAAGVRDGVLQQGLAPAGLMRVDGREFYAAYAPLTDVLGRPVAGLGVGVEAAPYSRPQNRTVTLFGGIIAAGMVFGFLMTYLFSAWLVRPIGELATGMDRVASGDLTYKVRYRSKDDLGKLVRAFNRMVRNVKERDIRLRDMNERRLSHMEKQVSIGRLAAGVAHEINNPMTSILSLSMVMRKEVGPDARHAEHLDIIVEEATRCRSIVRSLLDFARERPVQWEVAEIHDILDETLTLVRRYEGMDRVETIVEPFPEPLYVSCDPKQLQQVFTNLLTNAAEAMSEGGGRVTVRTDEDASGGYLLVQVIDEGAGMTPEDLERAFEPFFTTKGAHKGTGLGLSVSLGIIRKHNGTLEIQSEFGRGTTVTVQLPRVSPQGDDKEA